MISVRVVNEKERERRAPKAWESRRRGGGRGAAGAEVERHRREDRGAEGAEGGGVWGVPLPTGGGAGEGLCPSPETFFDFGSQYGEFWCILGGIFYSSVTCFTHKTAIGVAYKSRDGE